MARATNFITSPETEKVEVVGVILSMSTMFVSWGTIMWEGEDGRGIEGRGDAR